MNDLIDALLAALGRSQSTMSRSEHLLVELELWIAVLLVVVLVLRLVRRWVLRSRYEVDDLLLATSELPLRIIVVVAAIVNLLESLQLDPPWPETSLAFHALATIVKLARVGLVIALIWLAQRMLERAVIRVLANRATRTDTRLDDMLVPIARVLVRPVLYTVALIAFMDATGASTRGIAVAVGAGYLFLSFGAKSVLDDVFGGVSLLLDTPFGRGDLLELEDGTRAKVDHLGLRVTKMYDPVDHADLSVPNRILAGQKLVNLSRPTPEKRLTLIARVEASSPDEVVRDRLREAAYGHPWVLGQPTLKLPAMRRRIDRLVWLGDVSEALSMVKEMARIEHEGRLDAAIQHHAGFIYEMAAKLHRMEAGGFNDAERAAMGADLDRLGAMVDGIEDAMTRWLLMVRYTYVRGPETHLPPHDEAALRSAVAGIRRHGGPAAPDDIAEVHALTETALSPAFHHLAAYTQLVDHALADGAPLVRAGRIDRADLLYAMEAQERWLSEHGFGAPLGAREVGGFTDLDALEEYTNLFADWSDRTRQLRNTVAAILAKPAQGRGRLMDEDLLAVRRLLAREMHEAGPIWKEPSVALVDTDLGLEYELKAYVDNVKLSHFTRATKTAKQLRLDVMHLLRDIEPAVRLGRPIMLLDPSGAIVDSGQAVHIRHRDR